MHNSDEHRKGALLKFPKICWSFYRWMSPVIDLWWKDVELADEVAKAGPKRMPVVRQPCLL